MHFAHALLIKGKVSKLTGIMRNRLAFRFQCHTGDAPVNLNIFYLIGLCAPGHAFVSQVQEGRDTGKTEEGDVKTKRITPREHVGDHQEMRSSKSEENTDQTVGPAPDIIGDEGRQRTEAED